jgi:DNA repair protein RadC
MPRKSKALCKDGRCEAPSPSVPWVQICRDPSSMSKKISSKPVRSPRDAWLLLRDRARSEDQECFFVIILDVSGYARGLELVHRGTLDSMTVHAREVYRLAVVSGAHSIICAHNHPSGELRPSDADKALTFSLQRAGEILGIPLADHLIVTAKGFHSLARSGEM